MVSTGEEGNLYIDNLSKGVSHSVCSYPTLRFILLMRLFGTDTLGVRDLPRIVDSNTRRERELGYIREQTEICGLRGTYPDGIDHSRVFIDCSQECHHILFTLNYLKVSRFLLHFREAGKRLC